MCAHAQACQGLGFCANAADLRINCTYCINQFAGLMAAWLQQPGMLAAHVDGNMTSSGAGMWNNAAMALKAQCNDTAYGLQQTLGMASMIGTQMAPVFATGATNSTAICLANPNVCDAGNSQPRCASRPLAEHVVHQGDALTHHKGTVLSLLFMPGHAVPQS